jgi:benzylsuccinate CoA-transferase BbsF subunit
MIDFSVNGANANRSGNERAPICPHGVYPCSGSDRWIAISAGSDRAWYALVEVLGSPDWSGEETYATSVGRWSRRQEIDAHLAATTRRRSAEELMVELQNVGVAAGVVNTAADVVDRDPQLVHRGHWVTLNHPEMGPSIYNAPPFRIIGAPTVPRNPAPLLGQHTDEVCGKIFKIGESEIEALRRDGVLS